MLLGLAFMLVWAVGTVYLYSVGEPVKRDEYPIANVKWATETRYMWYFNLFAILWVIAFFVCSGDFVIGASACIWYFNQTPQGVNKKNKREDQKTSYSISPVCTAFYWLYRFHIGSIALGSFLLAVVWAIRLAMAYLHQKLKETGATKNKLVEYLMYVIQCFLACFERFIRFVNKQAFIYVRKLYTNPHLDRSYRQEFLLVNDQRFPGGDTSSYRIRTTGRDRPHVHVRRHGRHSLGFNWTRLLHDGVYPFSQRLDHVAIGTLSGKYLLLLTP